MIDVISWMYNILILFKKSFQIFVLNFSTAYGLHIYATFLFSICYLQLEMYA